MKDKDYDMKGALTAIADTLVMNLTLVNGQIQGESNRPMTWFGQSFSLHPTVLESLVDEKRGIMVVLTHVVGHLYVVVISDADLGKLQLFLLNGDSLQFNRPNAPRFLPKYWVREELYKRMHKGLKASFKKLYYASAWEPLDNDPNWMQNYLERKASDRSLRAAGI